MRRLQLYGTGNSTASAVANVTIPSAGKIRGVQVCVLSDATADNTSIRLELSRIPTSQISVNGATEPFLSVGIYMNIGAAGADHIAINEWFPLDVDVRQGEIIYLHATASATYYFNAILNYA